MALLGIDPVTRNRFQSNAKESVYRKVEVISEQTLGASGVYGRSCLYTRALISIRELVSRQSKPDACPVLRYNTGRTAYKAGWDGVFLLR